MWNPKIIDADKVSYVAISDAIERNVQFGVLKPGERMPPQRSLAKIIGVNLTTISRVYNSEDFKTVSTTYITCNVVGRFISR